MAFWFYRGLRRGIVTTRYPAGDPDPWSRSLPTPPAFRPERLTVELVDRLAARCASGALAREDATLVVDLGRCTGCGACLTVGAGAVVPSCEHLLASTDRRALVKRIPIGPEGGTR